MDVELLYMTDQLDRRMQTVEKSVTQTVDYLAALHGYDVEIVAGTTKYTVNVTEGTETYEKLKEGMNYAFGLVSSDQGIIDVGANYIVIENNDRVSYEEFLAVVKKCAPNATISDSTMVTPKITLTTNGSPTATRQTEFNGYEYVIKCTIGDFESRMYHIWYDESHWGQNLNGGTPQNELIPFEVSMWLHDKNAADISAINDVAIKAQVDVADVKTSVASVETSVDELGAQMKQSWCMLLEGGYSYKCTTSKTAVTGSIDAPTSQYFTETLSDSSGNVVATKVTEVYDTADGYVAWLNITEIYTIDGTTRKYTQTYNSNYDGAWLGVWS